MFLIAHVWFLREQAFFQSDCNLQPQGIGPAAELLPQGRNLRPESTGLAMRRRSAVKLSEFRPWINKTTKTTTACEEHVKSMWRACSLGECSNDNEHSDFGKCWRHRLLESGSLVMLKWFHAGTDNYGKLGLFKQTATAKFDSIQHSSPRISRVEVLTCQRYPEVVDLCSDLFWCASWTKHYQTWQQMAQELKSWVLQGLPGLDPSIPERASCPASLWRGSCKIMQKGA